MKSKHIYHPIKSPWSTDILLYSSVISSSCTSYSSAKNILICLNACANFTVFDQPARLRDLSNVFPVRVQHCLIINWIIYQQAHDTIVNKYNKMTSHRPQYNFLSFFYLFIKKFMTSIYTYIYKLYRHT